MAKENDNKFDVPQSRIIMETFYETLFSQSSLDTILNFQIQILSKLQDRSVEELKEEANTYRHNRYQALRKEVLEELRKIKV